MPYETAIKKAWEELEKVSGVINRHSVALLSDVYDIDIKEKIILSNSCNAPAKEYLSILLLHYLIGSLRYAYEPSGEWISFKEIEGGEPYYPAFHKSVIGPLLRKYGESPEGLIGVLGRFKGREIDFGDAAVELATFSDVFLRIVLWKADSEFGPEATILFDKNIRNIYSMEDVVVFSNFIIRNL